MPTPPSALVPANVARMIPYKPGKPAEELERELGISGALKLASNENPLGPSPRVVAAVREAAGGLALYPDGVAYALREALASHHDVTMDEVVTGNGSNELIDLICRTFPGRDEHVVYGKPSFVCYWLGCTAAGVPYTEVPLRDDLHWDVDAMLAAVRPETKVLFLANPNNPTGAYVGEADLRRLLSELPERVVAVIDEAYVEFPDAPDYVSALELRHLRERLLVLRTFSKAYGIAALRVGYAVGPAALVGHLHSMRAPFNVNALGQAGALAALSDSAHVEAYVRLNAEERPRVAKALEALGLEVAPSQANFLLVGFPGSGAEVDAALLRQGVITRPMPPPLGRYLRITLGTREMNDRLLQTLTSAALAPFLPPAPPAAPGESR